MRAAWALSLAVVVAACRATHPDGGAASTAPRPVRSVPVLRALADDVTVAGQVYARERAVLSARTAASIVAIPVREGDDVRAGTVVLRLEDVALKAAVVAARSARDAAEAERRRTATLLDRNAATPREMEVASARAAAAEAALDAAQDNLSYAVLRAPFHGVVTARRANVGDVIAPGQALIEIEGGAAFEVRAFVDGDQAARLERGQSLAVDVDQVGQPVAAKIRALSPAGDRASHRFELRADLESAAGLRSGVFARVRLPGEVAEVVLTIPRSALVVRGGLQGVFVVAHGKAWLRWIAIGVTTGDRVEVRAGLEDGERVAISPDGLEDGIAVVEES